MQEERAAFGGPAQATSEGYLDIPDCGAGALTVEYPERQVLVIHGDAAEGMAVAQQECTVYRLAAGHKMQAQTGNDFEVVVIEVSSSESFTNIACFPVEYQIGSSRTASGQGTRPDPWDVFPVQWDVPVFHFEPSSTPGIVPRSGRDDSNGPRPGL